MNIQALTSSGRPSENLAGRLNNKLARLKDSSKADLLQSVKEIKAREAGIETNKVEFNAKSRINEQQYFSAIALDTLKKLSNKFADKFAAKYQKEFGKMEKFDDPNSSLRAARRALRYLVQDGSLPQSVARGVRRIALGKAQLDNDRTTLRTSEHDVSSAKETLRSFDTAYEKYGENEHATAKEHKAFKKFVADEVRIKRELPEAQTCTPCPDKIGTEETTEVNKPSDAEVCTSSSGSTEVAKTSEIKKPSETDLDPATCDTESEPKVGGPDEGEKEFVHQQSIAEQYAQKIKSLFNWLILIFK